MILPTNDNEKPMSSKREETKRGARFVQELDLLELEGLLFCFDPKEAKRRHGKIALKDARQRKLGIEIHPHYGQPSKLAYKVELATLHKIVMQGCTLTEDGHCLFSEEVFFGPRELARLIPAALIDDRLRPLAAGDRGEPVGRRQQPVPGVAAGGDDGLVVRPDAMAELVLAQVLPDVLDRVQLGAVARQG